MSFESERLLIENQLKEYWNQTTISWGNIAFKIPSNEPWIRLNIVNGGSSYIALGGIKRHSGVIMVQIFTPINTGTDAARKYADMIVSIYDSKKLGNVICDAASIQILGATDVWYQVNVTIPYWRDE